MCIKAVEVDTFFLRFASDHLKTHEMFEKEFEKDSWSLKYMPDYLKTQKMCERAAVKDKLGTLEYVPNHFKTQEMCEKVVEKSSWSLKYIPDYLKKLEICDKTVKDEPYFLQFVPDWFVTQQQIKLWHEYNRPTGWQYQDDEIIGWYVGYKKRKAEKASIKEQLMPITWHPSRWWDWCVPEDEKRDKEKIFLTT